WALLCSARNTTRTFSESSTWETEIMIDFQDMSSEDLRELIDKASDEIRRRRVLASAEERMRSLTNEVLDAEGVASGEPWRETLFGYPVDWEVTHPLPDSDVEATWVNEVQGNRYAPGSP